MYMFFLLNIIWKTHTWPTYSVIVDVLQDIINNKPCLSPNEMTEDQLLMDLVQQGRNTSGSREDMVSRLMDQYLGPNHFFPKRRNNWQFELYEVWFSFAIVSYNRFAMLLCRLSIDVLHNAQGCVLHLWQELFGCWVLCQSGVVFLD